MHSSVRLVRQCSLAVALGLTLVAAQGCGGGGTANTHAVSGKVTGPDGSPLAGGSVSFDGTDSKGHKATGDIGPDGSYSLSTFEENDGAPEGEYNISVADAQGNSLTPDPAKATVAAGKPNTIDIKTKK
jgi:hypothetical protein